MANPFLSPASSLTSPTTAFEPRRSSGLTWFAAAASIIAIVVFFLIACVLFPQALRLASENAALPPRLQSGSAALVRASWFGGFAAAFGAVANGIGLLLIRVRKPIWSLVICLSTVLLMIAVAIAFKP